MRRTSKRLLALILALAMLAGTGSTFVGGNVYAAEVTGQTISGNELTNEPLEETTEEAVTEEAAEEVTEEAVEETVADEEEEADNTLSGNDAADTLSGNETDRKIQTVSQVKNTDRGVKIPGFTRIKGNTPLDPDKYYLIVTEDSAGKVYALYGNQSGFRNNGVLPRGENEKHMAGQMAAELTINDNDVTATWLNNLGKSISVNDLRFTVSPMDNGYSFRSAEGHYLDMGTQVFGNHSVKLTVSPDYDGIGDGEGYLIKNGNRYIYFVANGDTEKGGSFSGYWTDFWAPSGRMFDYFYTIALYEQDEERVTLDLTELEDMLDEAETAYPAQDDDTNKTKFTGITWIPFKRAREAAREVVGNPTASELTQEDVEDLEWNLRNTMKALAERRVSIEAEEYEYVLDTNGIDAGAKYVLYCGFGTGPRVISMNRDNGDAALTAGVRVIGNKLILDTSTRSEESQVWEAVDVGGGKFALKSTYGTTVGYFDLNRYGQNNVLLSSTPSELTITHTGGGGYGLTGAKSPYYNLTWLDDLGRGWIYARYPNIHRTSVAFYKQTPVASGGSQSLDIEDPAPPEGVTQSEQPFTDDIKGSTNFGSPSLTTFGDGKVAAAATIQWNSTNNYGGSDVVVSVFSNDEWRFTTPLYFNDTADTYVEQGASFSDPMLAANGEKLYLLANLFPGGAGKVTGRTGGDAPWSPQQASGYVEIDGEQRLVLYYTAITNQQNNSNYQYYIGDFNEEFGGKVYAPVYERLDEATYADTPSYYVDREYYLYEAVVDSNPKPMYCKQRAGSGATQKWVQQNVFFFESLLHVRCTNYLVLTTSENGGESWSEFTILTPEVKSSTETFYGTSSGGQGIVMGDGNLVVFPCYSWGNTSGGNSYASFIYSDDGGGTWKRSPNTMTWTGANETGVVKLADDRLRVFIGNGNTQLKYVDYTWNGQEWSVGGVIILTPNVHTTANRQVSAITYQLNDKTVIMISASRSNNSDGKIFTFELSDDAEKTMTLVDTYDMNPNQSNDYFAHSALIGHLSEAEGDSLSVLYESQSSPKKITYTTIHIGDILGTSYFQTKITGEIENRVYDGKRVEINELVKGLEVGKVPQDRTGNHTWEVYADEAGTNKLTEMPKDVGTYWVRARVEADSKYKENISNAIPFTIEQRPLTIRYVVVSDEAGNSLSGNSLSGNSLSGNTLVAHGVKEVYFEGLAEQEALTIEQDYTAVLAYNDENMDAANELEVTVALKNSALGKNYVLTSPTYTFEAEGHDDLWVSTVWSKEYTGSKVTQSFTLVDGNTLLKEGVDYTVSYKNNVNASEWELPKSDSESKEPKMVVESGDKAGVQLMSLGGTVDPSEIKDPSFNAKKAPQMIIKMKGNYTGTYTIYYQIEKISFTDNEDIAADDLTVTYTGKNQTPIPVVTWKGKKLVNNKDFYVKEYIAQKADKTAFTGKANEKTEIKLTLVGKGNYTGEKEIKLIIGKKDPNLEEVSMSKVTVKGMKTLIWDQAAAAAPEGMTQEALSVTYKKKGLIYQAATASTQEPAEQPKTEYTIRYENNTAVGTATLVLEGTGVDVDGDKLAYIGTKRIAFKITGNNISKAQVTGLEKSYPYTGGEIKPTELTSGGQKVVKFTYQANKTAPVTTLVEGTHYTVSYLKNINKGTATLVLTGNPEKGYTGTKKISFKIGADVLGTAEITDALAVKGDADKLAKMPYMKGGAKPGVTVRNQAGEVLVYGVDYTVSYKNNTKIADISATKLPTVVIKGKGNYSGTLEVHYEIVQKDLETYKDSVYIVANDKVESTKKNGWKQSFKVYDADGKVISAADYDKNAKYVLTKVGGVTTSLKQDQELIDPNTFVPAGSEITVTVTMKGANYKGTVSQTYRILQAGYDISKATIKINPKEYTGKEVLIEQKDLATAILKNGKEIKNLYLENVGESQKQNIQVVSYEKNINKGTAKVTFEGIGEYGGTKTVTFKIGQRSITQWFNDMYSTWKWSF